ncbi:hypothetical protein [Streptomyces sp. NPDC057854]|uniref:hypothetical protein n=1 Tax=Streptomyces sp. NPDC057854 TaxID=3346264 RepID=UPI0036CECCA6
MSSEIFVSRFENGGPAPLDLSAARELLAPHVVAEDPSLNLVQISTGERESADVYFSGPGTVTFHHAGGEGVMDLLAELLRRLDAVAVVPGGPVIVRREADREGLPAGMADVFPVVVALTGAAIAEAIRTA